jgi:hypothetical protein
MKRILALVFAIGLLAVPLIAQPAATDDFPNQTVGLDSPYTHLAAVTPNDSTDLTNVTRGIFVGGAGALKVTTVGGESVTLTGVAAGSVLRIRATRIWSTGTTATTIAALW